MYQVQLKLKSFDPFYINQVVLLLNDVCKTFSQNIIDYKEVFIPSKTKKITVIRSPHIYKKSRDQFQIKKYKRSLIISFSDYNVLHVFLEICKDLHLVGVQMHISVKDKSYYK